MRCPECISPLYYSEIKKLLKCFKCNWTSEPSNIEWTCEICGEKFNSKVKEFVKFETKPEINCVKYALINKIHARPFKSKCCGINPMNMKFFHVECGGEYLLSYLQRKIVVVCGKCKIIQKPEDVKWRCQKCKNYFFCDKIIVKYNKIENNFNKELIKSRSNCLFKENLNNNINYTIKNNSLKKGINNNEKCLTSAKTRKFKSNKLQMKLIKIPHNENLVQNDENKNIVKKNLHKYLKAMKSRKITNSSNSSFIDTSNFNLKRKGNLSDSSLELYVFEKNLSIKKLIKNEEKNIIKDEKALDEIKVDKNEVIKEKHEIIEEIKGKEKNEIEIKENLEKIGETKDKTIEEKDKIIETTKKKIIKKIKFKNEKKEMEKEKEKSKNINIMLEEKKERLKNEVNEAKKKVEDKEKDKDKEINNSINKNKKIKSRNNNQNKYNIIKKVNGDIIQDKTNTKGQSQKKSKNIRFNFNLNININNLLDDKHNNNSIHVIKHINSLKKIPKIKKNNLEPDENFNPDEFKIIEKIGYGSYGKIYNVKWIRNNKNYAMKIINLKYIEDIEDTKKKLKIVSDFIKKTNCEGIIKTYGSLYEKIGEEEYKYYILMELAQTDWEEEIKKKNKKNLYYSENEIFNMIQQLVQCFSLLQKNNVCHRDVKPQNILVLNGMYKVCDFGEARIISGKNGYIHQPIRGSELYMSPILFEALNNHERNVLHNSYKSDVFSLGMCIFLAATLSFDSVYEIREEKNMSQIKKILEKYLIPHYSNYLVNILFQMLQIDEEYRPNFIDLESLLFYS